jgi:hypothetical protein
MTAPDCPADRPRRGSDCDGIRAASTAFKSAMKHRGEERQGNDLRSRLNGRIPLRPSYAVRAGADHLSQGQELGSVFDIETTLGVSPHGRENASIDGARAAICRCDAGEDAARFDGEQNCSDRGKCDRRRKAESFGLSRHGKLSPIRQGAARGPVYDRARPAVSLTFGCHARQTLREELCQ